MARLIGAQRMVLQAILDLPKDHAGYVTDDQISRHTQMLVSDVRDWVETLEGEGYVQVARTGSGLSVLITAQGKLEIRQFQPFGATPGATPAAVGPQTPPAASPAGASGQGASPTTPPVAGSGPIRLFYSYSHVDEALRKKLENHLKLMERNGLIAGWQDRMIGAGDEWKGEINRSLEEAQVILLLVSDDFLASDYCWDVEAKRALERHERGEAKVIPIILRPCDWSGAPFSKLQGLPKDAKPVTTWSNADEAWTDVARGIKRVVEALRAKGG
jgi:hypothetical protein